MPSSTCPQLRGAEFFSVSEVALSAFRISSDFSFRHSHDFHELVLVTGGTGQHQLFLPNGCPSDENIMKKGELFSIPMGWSHSYGDSSNLEIFNLIFAPQLLESWQYSTPFAILDNSVHAPTRWTLQRGEFEHLETLLQNITREFVGRRQGYGLAAQAMLAEVLVWLERLTLQSNERRNPESDRVISKAVAFMEQGFPQPITLDDIARTVHLSPNYFCEVFKNSTGLSPGRYLLRLRLEHARYLLLSTSHPVTHIAHESGFTDASYFARAFKAAFGTAPTRLRSTGR